MKLNRLVYWAVALFPIFLTLAFYPFMPEMIPLRDTMAWAPKFPTVFAFPLATLLISAISALLPRIESSHYNSMRKISVCVTVFATLLSVIFIILILV